MNSRSSQATSWESWVRGAGVKRGMWRGTAGQLGSGYTIWDRCSGGRVFRGGNGFVAIIWLGVYAWCSVNECLSSQVQTFRRSEVKCDQEKTV